MTSNNQKCPKCQSEMKQGFVLNREDDLQFSVSCWVPGAPKKLLWGRLIKLPKERLIPIGTFRCIGCGYLESYAMPEFSAD